MNAHPALAAGSSGPDVALPGPHAPGAAAGEAVPAFLPALELLLLALLLRLFGRAELPAPLRPLLRRQPEAFAPWLVQVSYVAASGDAEASRAALRRARRLAAWAGWIMRFFPARGMALAAPAAAPAPSESARAPPSALDSVLNAPGAGSRSRVLIVLL